MKQSNNQLNNQSDAKLLIVNKILEKVKTSNISDLMKSLCSSYLQNKMKLGCNAQLDKLIQQVSLVKSNKEYLNELLKTPLVAKISTLRYDNNTLNVFSKQSEPFSQLSQQNEVNYLNDLIKSEFFKRYSYLIAQSDLIVNNCSIKINPTRYDEVKLERLINFLKHSGQHRIDMKQLEGQLINELHLIDETSAFNTILELLDEQSTEIYKISYMNTHTLEQITKEVSNKIQYDAQNKDLLNTFTDILNQIDLSITNNKTH